MPTSPTRRKTASLPERLKAIARRVPDGGVVCDVGSDHGLLPLYLLRRRPGMSAVVTDLRPQPLARAEAALTEGGVSDRAVFLLTDGIAELADRQIDCFVIAGMSGETIARILSEGQGAVRAGQCFCLQPMSHEDLLRAFLIPAGFCITEEEVVRENGKLFLLIFATFTGMARPVPDDAFCALGDCLPRRPGEWGRSYYEEKRRSLQSVAEKRRLAGIDVTKEMDLIARIDRVLEEMP